MIKKYLGIILCLLGSHKNGHKTHKGGGHQLFECYRCGERKTLYWPETSHVGPLKNNRFEEEKKKYENARLTDIFFS